jgi:signal transduction histidine kinase
MRQQLKTLNNSRFGLSLIGLVLCLVLVHFLILTYYMTQHAKIKKPTAQQASNHALLKLIIDTDRVVPSKDLEDALNQVTATEFNNSRVNVSLTDRPKWPLRFNHDTPWSSIVEALDKNPNPARSFSYQMSNGRWLNYQLIYTFTLMQNALLFMFLEFLLISVIVLYGWSIMRFVIPLRNFKASAERLGIDVNSTPISAYGPSVAKEAAQAINKMQQRIQDLIDTRTKMLAAISHDLRTPITRLKLRAQFISDETQASKITADLDEMEAMINGVLSFAKSDVFKEVKQKFDLNALVASICYDYLDMGHTLDFKGMNQTLPFFGRSMALKRAFSNIIGNAVKYAPRVWVTLRIGAKTAHICIEDNGPGIPATELQKVFQAYYRSEHGKATASTGSGLGLTIANEVIYHHEGTIKLQNKPSGGLQVNIELPL